MRRLLPDMPSVLIVAITVTGICYNKEVLYAQKKRFDLLYWLKGLDYDIERIVKKAAEVF